jgi:transposase
MASQPWFASVCRAISKRADRLKLLLWDGSGVVLLSKRLEQGSFRWPSIGDGVMRLSASQLSALLEGLDWTRVRPVRVRTPSAVS